MEVQTDTGLHCVQRPISSGTAIYFPVPEKSVVCASCSVCGQLCELLKIVPSSHIYCTNGEGPDQTVSLCTVFTFNPLKNNLSHTIYLKSPFKLCIPLQTPVFYYIKVGFKRGQHYIGMFS